MLAMVLNTWVCWAQDAALPPSQSDSSEPVAVFQIPDSPKPAPNDPLMDEVHAELDRDVPVEASVVPTESADKPVFLINLSKSIGALFLVCALIFLLAYLIKRYGRKVPALAGAELAQSLGQVHLTPNVSLHFVETGGKVLVIGISPNSMATVAQFDAVGFHAATALGERAIDQLQSKPDTIETSDFLREFRESLEEMRKPTSAGPSDEAEITALREDVQRLQQYLQEGAHADKD